MNKATKIPDGWHEIVLEELFDFKKGQGLSKEKINQDGKSACILYGELYTTYSEVISDVVSRTNEMEGVLSKAGDILIPASTTTSALDLAIATSLDKSDVLLGGDINILRKKRDTYNSHFFAYLLRYHDNVNLARFAQGSTIIHLSGRHIRTLNVCVPSDEWEQKKVADILMALDNTIETTEGIVNKYRNIRQGMLRDLLRYGIDESGRIRNEKTHKFKKTPIGNIPVEWDYELLDTLAQRGSGHTPNKSHPEYWNGGIKWVSLADTFRLDDFFINDTEYQISNEGIKHSSAVLHSAGSVLLSRDAGIGKSAIMSEPMAVSQHFMVWRCGERLNNHYLYFWLQNDKRTFEAIASGSTIVTIGLSFFKNYRIPFPTSLPEQKRIAGALVEIEGLVKKETDYLDKLKAMKKGLMNDLFTGTTRVTHLIEK